jgi:hypothetical protein
MTTKSDALAELHASRAAVEKTLGEFKTRFSPPQLAEDAMNLLDPDLTLLGRIKSGVQQNRLLSLAVLAGVGWLVGAPRRSKDEPQNPRNVDTAPSSSTPKENKNDSGKINGDEWPVSLGDSEEPRTQGRRTQRRSKAEAGSGTARHGQHGERTLDKERREEQLEAQGSQR